MQEEVMPLAIARHSKQIHAQTYMLYAPACAIRATPTRQAHQQQSSMAGRRGAASMPEHMISRDDALCEQYHRRWLLRLCTKNMSMPPFCGARARHAPCTPALAASMRHAAESLMYAAARPARLLPGGGDELPAACSLTSAVLAR